MADHDFFDNSSSSSAVDMKTITYGPRKPEFLGTVERLQYIQDKENKNLINRQIEVRRQEAEISRNNLQKRKEKQQKIRDQDIMEAKAEEYIRIKKALEDALKAKELAEREYGKAHREAEESQRQKEARENQERENLRKFNEAERGRFNSALTVQRELEEQLNGPKRRLIEQRKQVLMDETNRAHQIAVDFREKQKDAPIEEKDDFVSYQIFDKNVSRRMFKTKASDFSNTHLHNPIVVSHINEEGLANAFDAAQLEGSKTETRRSQFLASAADTRMKSLERWQKAVQKENDRKYQESFEHEMAQLQKAQNVIKIHEGKTYPEMQTKPATTLQNRTRTQKLAEKEFEELFINKKKNFISEGNRFSKENLIKENQKKLLKTKRLRAAAKSDEDEPDKSMSERSRLTGFTKTNDGNNGRIQFDDHATLENEAKDPRYDDQSEAAEEENTDDYPEESQRGRKPASTKNDLLNYSSSEGLGSPERFKDNNEYSRSAESMASSFVQQDIRPETSLKEKRTLSTQSEQDKPTKNLAYTSEYDVPNTNKKYYQTNESVQKSSFGDTENYMYGGRSADDLYHSESTQGRGESSNRQYAYQGESHMSKRMDTSNLRPENMRHPFDNSYKQSEYKNYEPAKTEYSRRLERQNQYSNSFEQDESKTGGNQSSSLLGDYKRTNQSQIFKREPASFEEADSKGTSESQSKKDVTENEIRNYIQEQEHFLKKLENDRRKLNEKLKASQQPIETKEDESELQSDLQKKAETLLSKFMQPSKSSNYPVSDNETNSEQNEFSPQKFDRPQSFKSQYLMESQSNSGFRKDDPESYSPEKSQTFEYSQRIASPSDLDYSVSERDKSERKQYKNSSTANEYVQSLGDRSGNSTGTFGLTKNVLEHKASEDGSKKGWKMDFANNEPAQKRVIGKKKPTLNVRNDETDQPRVETKKAWRLDFDKDDNHEKHEVEGVSLADMFKRNKKQMIEKYERQQNQEDKPEQKEQKPSRTKEEMLKQRKAMMEYKGPVAQKSKSQTMQEEAKDQRDALGNPSGKSSQSKNGPNSELLDRLAFGKKSKVSKKDMLALTNKNYDLLPEVKKRKEDDMKKEAAKKRQENVKKLDQRVRNNLQNKTLK